jgi:hypothetical protein
MYSNERIAVSVREKTQVQDKPYDCDGRHQIQYKHIWVAWNVTSHSYDDEPLAESGENTNVVTDQDDILPGTLEATAQFNSVIRVVYVNVICYYVT